MNKNSLMAKILKKQHKIHWVHLMAIIILGSYLMLSKINLIYALSNNNLNLAFMQIYLFGVFFTYIFLYIFCHDNFFPIAKQIEKEEENHEKKFLKRYLRFGKIITTFIAGSFGGPIFLSLTIRLLFKDYRYKYLLVILVSIPSTLVTIAISHGFSQFLYFIK